MRGRSALELARGARGHDRELDHEPGTPLGGVLRPDASLVLAHDAQRNGEPEPRARPRGLGGEERVEDALEQIGWDAGTRVFGLDPDQVAGAAGANGEALLVSF